MTTAVGSFGSGVQWVQRVLFRGSAGSFGSIGSGHGEHRRTAALSLQIHSGMSGARSHEELIVWQLADELKIAVYALIRTGPIRRDADLLSQLRRSASSAPRQIAEGFGRYLPGEFSRYLRNANGEFKEIYDALKDGTDRGYFTTDQILPLQRLTKRASKAATNLIKYLHTATPPHEPRPPRRQPAATPRRRSEPPEPPRPPEPSEPSEPPEPPEPDL